MDLTVLCVEKSPRSLSHSEISAVLIWAVTYQIFPLDFPFKSHKASSYRGRYGAPVPWRPLVEWAAVGGWWRPHVNLSCLSSFFIFHVADDSMNIMSAGSAAPAKGDPPPPPPVISAPLPALPRNPP